VGEFQSGGNYDARRKKRLSTIDVLNRSSPDHSQWPARGNAAADFFRQQA
jgi:hypothetical protein